MSMNSSVRGGKSSKSRRALAAAASMIEPLEQRQLLSVLPDLSAASGAALSGSSSAIATGVLSVHRSYSVSGAAIASDFCIQYALSTDQTWGGDILCYPVEKITQSSGKTVGTHSGSTSLAVPASATPGKYYLLAKLDSANQVAESTENNNILVGSQVTINRPGNDNFAKAAPISGTSVTSYGTNVNATAEANEPAHAGYVGGHSIWWAWTAAGTGPVTVSAIGSSFNTLLEVYKGGSVSLLTYVAHSAAITPSTGSSLTFNAVQGQIYKIAVDGRNGATGSIKLTVNQTLPAPAAPARIYATQTDNTAVVVSWTVPVNATSYELWRGTTSDPAAAKVVSSAARNITANYFTDKSAVAGTTYWYWVKAKNGTGTSAFSPAAIGVRIPTFTSTSGDGSKISYFNAAKGSSQTYDGLLDAAATSTVVKVSLEKLLNVNCIRIDRVTSDASAHVTASDTLWLAKDSSSKLWVFKQVVDGYVRFQAQSLAQLISAANYDDIQVRLMSGTFDVGTTVSEMDGSTDKIVSTDCTLPGDSTVFVVSQHQTTNGDVLFQYFSQANGWVSTVIGKDGDLQGGWELRGYTPS